nr:ubiquitin carboxyl-terminal hydrolase 14 [Quercus suber]
MATACVHIDQAALRPPRPSQSVYREDCTLCFDSIDDPAGLDVCLHCFNGACAGERIHSRQHAQQAQHPIAVNIRRTRKRKQRNEGEPPEKISKLAIKAERDEDRYIVQTDVHCFECGVTGIGQLDEVVDGIMKANTFAKEAEVKAWEVEMTACEHTLCLEQEPAEEIPSGALGQCTECDLKENLWLCLQCGNLGCGRQQAGGLPGNSHAKAHGSATGHPIAVKLGSLTAEGNADIYCYGCDEERIDPELVAHLGNWGIDIAGRVKTEKSLTEMQIDQNMSWDFSMTNEDGQVMKPLFGAGFTGLKNLGNSCYLASVLQSLFSMPEFRSRYYRPEEPVSATVDAAEDLEIQLRKLADGLLSGRYSKPDFDVYPIPEEATDQAHQKGLAPAMLKHLIGRGHGEFSTMRQQDSFELLLHLLKIISRSQSSAQNQYKDITDPVQSFRFVMEQKLQCLACKKVRYRIDEMENLSVAVPIKRMRSEDTPMIVGGKNDKKEEFEPVSLKQCLDDYTAPEVVELNCAGCGNTGFTKQSLFKTFPTILAINARRFEIVNWVPTKQDVPVVVGDEIVDLESYRSPGKQPGEEELPDDQDASSAKTTNSFVPDAAGLEALVSMGFPQIRCEKALHATGNGDAEVAASWLFEHMEDSDIDAPLDLGVSGGSTNVADPEKIENLGNMGFSAPQARQALKETGGDMERAIDWLFSHPDAQGDFDESTTVSPAALTLLQDTKAAYFKLNSIVCHKGTSIHAGHYVAFIKKQLPKNGQGWVLYNDEKVALGADVEEMKKFAYIYFFRREAEV